MSFGKKTRRGTLGNKRKTERSKTFASSIIETPASRYRVTIVEISQSGARIAVAMPFVDRRELRIRVNEIDLFGIVVWRKDNCLGIKFDEILSDHNSSEIVQAVIAAEAYSRQFDREASLQALVNTPGCGNAVDSQTETNGTSAPGLPAMVQDFTEQCLSV